MKLFILSFLVFISLIFEGFARFNNKTFFYESSSVELQGVLSLKTFPGPPNYESIKTGDEAEDGYYLELNELIDVVPKPNTPPDDADEIERNLKLIQLIVDDDKLYPIINKCIKTRENVILKGSLVHQLTGHHHTKVLIKVIEITRRKK